MPQNVSPAGKLATYHHGDLKAALILAARDALSAGQLDNLTLKSLALRLGVSQPAPYRHFKSRDALLSAVAQDGFERFLDKLAVAEQDGAVDGALRRLCLAYIDFGQDNWGVYGLMFSRRVLAASDPGSVLSRATDESFKLLAKHVSRRVGPIRGPRASVSTWAILHGIVTLTAEGLIHGPLDRQVKASELVDEVLLSFFSKGAD